MQTHPRGTRRLPTRRDQALGRLVKKAWVPLVALAVVGGGVTWAGAEVARTQTEERDDSRPLPHLEPRTKATYFQPTPLVETVRIDRSLTHADVVDGRTITWTQDQRAVFEWLAQGGDPDYAFKRILESGLYYEDGLEPTYFSRRTIETAARLGPVAVEQLGFAAAHTVKAGDHVYGHKQKLTAADVAALHDGFTPSATSKLRLAAAYVNNLHRLAAIAKTPLDEIASAERLPEILAAFSSYPGSNYNGYAPPGWDSAGSEDDTGNDDATDGGVVDWKAVERILGGPSATRLRGRSGADLDLAVADVARELPGAGVTTVAGQFRVLATVLTGLHVQFDQQALLSGLRVQHDGADRAGILERFSRLTAQGETLYPDGRTVDVLEPVWKDRGFDYATALPALRNLAFGPARSTPRDALAEIVAARAKADATLPKDLAEIVRKVGPRPLRYFGLDMDLSRRDDAGPDERAIHRALTPEEIGVLQDLRADQRTVVADAAEAVLEVSQLTGITEARIDARYLLEGTDGGHLHLVHGRFDTLAPAQFPAEMATIVKQCVASDVIPNYPNYPSDLYVPFTKELAEHGLRFADRFAAFDELKRADQTHRIDPAKMRVVRDTSLGAAPVQLPGRAATPHAVPGRPGAHVTSYVAGPTVSRPASSPLVASGAAPGRGERE